VGKPSGIGGFEVLHEPSLFHDLGLFDRQVVFFVIKMLQLKQQIIENIIANN
jgi:hypothetical protein